MNFLCLILTLFLSSSFTAEDVVNKTGDKILSLNSLKADFEQLYYSISVSRPLVEKGKFYFKKPQLMKWEYMEPEKNIFLYKDRNFFFYVPEENQLTRGLLEEGTPGTEILDILSGKKTLQADYIIEFSPFPTEKDHVYQIKLTPKEETEYSFILLEIERKTWLIGRAIFFDWAGNKTEFRFSNIKTNVKFPKNTFELKLPPDVEIIDREHG